MSQSCAPFGVYAFADVAFNMDGRLVIGFAEGDDAISVERPTDIGKPKRGVDGTTIVSISSDQSADVVIKLMYNSPFNAWMRNKVARMRMTRVGITFPIGFTDLGNGESGGCTNGIIVKEPKLMRGAEAADQEWGIFCPCWQPGDVLLTTGLAS